MQYDFVKAVNVDQLTQEIRSSAIITALNYISAIGNNISIFFKATLSGGDETILDTLVAAHAPVALPNNFLDSLSLNDNLIIPATPPAEVGRLFANGKKLQFINEDGLVLTLSNINELQEKMTPRIGDELLIWDAETSGLRKIKSINSIPTAIPLREATYDEDDFAGSTSAGKLNWTATVNGTGASTQTGAYGVNGTERAYGVLQIDTGTTVGGRASIGRLLGQVQLGYGVHTMVWRLALEALSTGTERFHFVFGFYNNSGAGLDSTNGVYFRYRDDLNSGSWQCVCRDNGAETLVNTNVVVDVQYSIFKIEINDNGSQALFYINDVLVATIASNIPVTAGRFTGVSAKIEKTVGAAQRNASFDYYHHKVIFSGGR